MWLLIANLLIRSSLILGAGAILCRLLVRQQPKQRHSILLSSFLLLLLWPILATWLPAVSFSVGDHQAVRDSVTVQQFSVGRHSSSVTNGLVVSPIHLWAMAVLVVLTPLLMAHIRLRGLVKRASVCSDESKIDLLRELCGQLGVAKPPVLLIHPESLMPMATGLWRPGIVLPSDCYLWTQARWRIVLLHELAHITRGDLLSQCCARVVAALWWFQPLSWGVLRLLRRESERACDELVIASGVRPSDYAAELLAIAQTFSANRPGRVAGIAMAREGGLQSRVQAILKPANAKVRRPIPLLVSFFSLAALTILASAVTPAIESQPLSTRGQHMKHTLFASLLASAGLSAATIGGSLYDPSGAAVPNAKALLYDPDTNTKFETSTSADGKFTFEALPAGQYILRVQSPGFATLFREFNVKTDSKVDRGLTLALGKVQETVNVAAEGVPNTAMSATPAQKPVRVGGSVAQSNLVTKVQPLYPKAAKAAGVQGTVLLEMVISKEGEPLDIRVLDTPSDDLTQSALEAVRQWRYKPTLLNGNPVEIVTDVVVNYTLMK